MIRIRAMATLSRISLAVPLGGGGLRQNGDALRMASLVVPVSGNMVQSLARVRLFSQFRGTQLGNVKRVAPELKRGTNFEGSIRRSHGRAVAYTGEESMRETQGLESLKASQIKKVQVYALLYPT